GAVRPRRRTGPPRVAGRGPGTAPADDRGAALGGTPPQPRRAGDPDRVRDGRLDRRSNAMSPAPPAPKPDRPASALEVLISLRFAERASQKAIRSELAGSGVHAGQEFVLDKLLRHGSIRVAQLAEMLDVQVPTATK